MNLTSVPWVASYFRPRAALAVFATLLAGPAWAAVSLPAIFSDHLVLQRESAVPVWGRADAGEAVEVRFAGQAVRTTAGADGRWRVALAPMPAKAEPSDLVVVGTNTLTVTDVLVGDVWLCSGQSNMEKPIGARAGQRPTFEAEEELKKGEHPGIRFIKIARTKSPTPVADIKGAWMRCTPETLDAGNKVSAAGYYFGRQIHQEVGVPIGLIDSSYGGTRIEPWTAPEAFATVASLHDFAEAVKTTGTKVENSLPSELYYAMVQPVVPYALKGILWYQGETNFMDLLETTRYTDKMEALVEGWRTVFENPSLPFYYVQIAPHLYHVVRSHQVVLPTSLPLFWEAQQAALRIPHTGMVVTTDLVDDLLDIHPRNKRDVGLRLANLALARTYGKADLVDSGPVFAGLSVVGDKAIVRFVNTAGGLKSKNDKPLTWFRVAGADGVVRAGTAVIDGDTVVVTSPQVSQPVTVTFAWDEAAQPNLVNGVGLPALPFRSDGPFARN